MNKAAVVGSVAGLVILGIAIHHCRADAPPVTYRLEQFPITHYTLEPVSDLGAVVRLAYDTPCGKQTAELRVGNREPDEDGVVVVPYPADRRMPEVTHVRLDPKLTGSAKLGIVPLDRETDVLEAQCGAHLAFDDKDAGEVPLRDRTGAKILFVTARTETCFVDVMIHYSALPSGFGRDHPDPKIREGANAYWLAQDHYDFWFAPIPSSVTSYALGREDRAAFDECDGLEASARAAEQAAEPAAPSRPHALTPRDDN